MPAASDDHRLSPNARGNARVAEADALRRRQDDAPDLPGGFVVQGRGTGYFVRSRTQEGVWWLVAGRSCSCPAGQSGAERCFHRSQVAEFCRRLDDEQRRPTATPNISALVD